MAHFLGSYLMHVLWFLDSVSDKGFLLLDLCGESNAFTSFLKYNIIFDIVSILTIISRMWSYCVISCAGGIISKLLSQIYINYLYGLAMDDFRSILSEKYKGCFLIPL